MEALERTVCTHLSNGPEQASVFKPPAMRTMEGCQGDANAVPCGSVEARQTHASPAKADALVRERACFSSVSDAGRSKRSDRTTRTTRLPAPVCCSACFSSVSDAGRSPATEHVAGILFFG